MTQVPAGWYPSPDTAGQLQYWDGTAWTDFRAVAQTAATAPAVAQPVAAAPVPVPVAAQPTPAPQADAPLAAAPTAKRSMSLPAGSGRRSQLIAFAGGTGLFILGFVIGRL